MERIRGVFIVIVVKLHRWHKTNRSLGRKQLKVLVFKQALWLWKALFLSVFSLVLVKVRNPSFLGSTIQSPVSLEA